MEKEKQRVYEGEKKMPVKKTDARRKGGRFYMCIVLLYAGHACKFGNEVG